MKNNKLTVPGLRTGKTTLLLSTAVALSMGCHKSTVNNKDLKDFSEVILVANEAKYNPATTVDPTLQNAFGVAWNDQGVAWVNSVLGHVSELYSPEGVPKRVGVNIPQPKDTIGGLPCGVVYADDFDFNMPDGKDAIFIFSSFDGVLSAWDGGNNAQRIAAPAGASYTGLALASNGGHNFIYGANFGQNKIDVWDQHFKRVSMTFKDPTMPDAYSPYNIQAVGNWLFVMYAELATSGPTKGHGIPGAGKGFVSVFNTDGSFVKRFASRGSLNIPWGVTMAPGTWLEGKDLGNGGGGDDDGDGDESIVKGGQPAAASASRDAKDPIVLVGNFGDGHINVYSQEGSFLGQLQTKKHPMVIDGLWALSFPPQSAGIDPNRLYFTAGPESESDGLFGYIIKK
jgi:uncharacterized protein (TIGR03118 family)